MFTRTALALAALIFAGSLGAAEVRSSAADQQLHNQVISNALSATARVRAAVEDYHLRHNALPADSADLGLDPQSWATPDIKRVSVGANGRIEITLAATSGVEDGVIRLTPTASASTDENKIDWSCTSPSYSTIADATSGFCEYSKLP